MSVRLGLIVDRDEIMRLPLAAAQSASWISPRHCDQTHYTLPTGDQGATPSCVGQGFAAAVEAWQWAEHDNCQQVNGLEIYAAAKRLDGKPDQDGTSLLHGARAAEALHGLKGAHLHVASKSSAMYAIHRCRGFNAAFNARADWTGDNPVVGLKGDVIGPHNVWACGYDEFTLWIQNSWGLARGWFGFQRVPWPVFEKDFLYGLAIDTRGT